MNDTLARRGAADEAAGTIIFSYATYHRLLFDSHS
jgi:hypothetical protein